MTKIFIIILNWNRPEDTIDCLKSIDKMLLVKGFELRVIVVDNGSTDESVINIKIYLQTLVSDTKKILRKGKNHLSQIRNNSLDVTYNIVENRTNLGFAGGNNVGIQYALKNGADYVMVLNNDTILDKNIINEFTKASHKFPEVGIFSPKIYFAKGFEFRKDRYRSNELGKVIWYAGGKIDWDNLYGTNIGVDEVDKGQFEKPGEIDFATGTCMFIRAAALKKSGGFNEKYYMYLEDVELSLRMKKRRFDIYFIPSAKLWHKVSQSSAIGNELNDYFIHRNRLLLGMKYAKIRTRFALYRESLRFLWSVRPWQRRGVMDFYLGILGKGSWTDKK